MKKFLGRNRAYETALGADEVKDTTPEFLRYLLEAEIPDEEFFINFCKDKADTDIPLWWRRDIPVNLTKRERKNEIKRQKAKNKYIEERLELQKRLNDNYALKVKKDEEDFKRRLAENDALLELKLREIELNAEENAAVFEKELIEQEARLREAVRERQEAELQLKNEEQLKKRQLYLLGKIEEIQGKLNAVTEAVLLENMKKEESRLKYLAVREENLKLAEQSPELPKSLDPGTARNEIRVVTKKYEEFDPNNILELKDIHFKRREENGYLLKGVSFAVKRNRATVLYSENEVKLDYVKKIIKRTYPSDMHIVQGVLRVDGKEAGQVPKDEYKDVFGRYFISLSSACDRLIHIKNPAKNFFKDYDEIKLKSYLELFGLPAKQVFSRSYRVNSDNLYTLGLTAVLASDKPLGIIEKPEFILNREALGILMRYLSEVKLPKAVLVMTASLPVVNGIAEAGVYKL